MTESIEDFQLRSFRGDGGQSVKAPTVHIARGYEQYIPILESSGRPIVCISDWQCETHTQRYFWTQAWRILQQQVGIELLERALVIVAGDMASKNNALRGAKSDDAPDYSWLQESFPQGDIFIAYGNHDYISREHLKMINQTSGVPCLLPHGDWVGVPLGSAGYNLVSQAEIDNILDDEHENGGSIRIPKARQPTHVPEFLQHMTKAERKAYYAKQSFSKTQKPSQSSAASKGLQWNRDHPEQARLTACFRQVQSLAQTTLTKQLEDSSTASPPLVRIGAVHGIPASHNQGLQKVEREEYFQALNRVCDPSASVDVLVTHTNPCLPGQEAFVQGADPRRMYTAFLESPAFLHVCGHMHMDPPVAIVEKGKVVVNADCRVVAFVPP